MLTLELFARDTRIGHADYVFEDYKQLKELMNYVRPKIDGDWKIALVDPAIQAVREIIDNQIVPDYVQLVCYLEKNILAQIKLERPSIIAKTKTAYEKFLDMVSDMKVLIDQKAANELYRRVGKHKDKLEDYLLSLQTETDSVITLDMVKARVIDERRLYASEVLIEFLRSVPSRWKKYDKLVKDLGRDYTFFSFRKYARKLLIEKNKYLRNEECTIREIGKIDAFSIDCAYILFSTRTSAELDVCMYSLDNREFMRRVL